MDAPIFLSLSLVVKRHPIREKREMGNLWAKLGMEQKNLQFCTLLFAAFGNRLRYCQAHKSLLSLT